MNLFVGSKMLNKKKPESGALKGLAKSFWRASADLVAGLAAYIAPTNL